jgi:DNA-binding PadR family transcriptional regulator
VDRVRDQSGEQVLDLVAGKRVLDTWFIGGAGHPRVVVAAPFDGIDSGYLYSLSMRELFLALLAEDSGYGYEIKQALEAEFDDLLPTMNTGQIYSTLARLERDGLVAGEAVVGDSRGKRVYRLTTAGREHLARWIEAPVPGTRLKDEFFMKFAIATSVGLAAPRGLIERQRHEYLQSLRDLDAAAAHNGKGPAAQLLVEGAVLHLKADLAWLELIEERLTQWERAE